MVEKFWLGMGIIFVSGILNGSFALPLKYSTRWKWENTWSVFSLTGILLLPWLLAFWFDPHLGDVYRAVPLKVVVTAILFGVLWGVAQVTYGLSLVAVGLSVAVAVVSGLGCVSGSLIPLLVMDPSALLHPRGVFLLCSMPILFWGLAVYASAGRMREAEQNSRPQGGCTQPKPFRAGLALCIFTGVFASAFNLGFAFSGDVIRQAVKLGAPSATAGYAVWSLVLGAGFFPNILYCAYLLFRNRTFKLFQQSGWAREAMLAVTMAVVWLAGLILYGWGATLIGEYGTSVGFALFISITVVSGSALGILTGEWRSTSARSKRLLAMGVAAILLSVVVLNIGGFFASRLR